MKWLFSILALPFFSCTPPPPDNLPKSIYDYKVESLDGDTINFADFKGKKILIVNTASKCGFTKQYAGLESLYEGHKDKLVIVGFPANNFGKQEPGSNEEIGAFCQKNYGVTFPMAAKVSVKGADIAPIYQWLTNASANGYKTTSVGWNFQKYLINEKGQLVGMFESSVAPDAKELVAAVEQ
jgi:glutathione peroxidase